MLVFGRVLGRVLPHTRRPASSWTSALTSGANHPIDSLKLSQQLVAAGALHFLCPSNVEKRWSAFARRKAARRHAPALC